MSPTARPLNIVQITTHDSGRFVGCYGHPTVHTPGIDRIAADGVKLTDYFATVPICCASRASMLTGRYPQRHGLLDLCFPPFDWRIDDGVDHLAGLLSRNGYRSILFGFQHEAARDDIDRLGFDERRLDDGLRPCGEIAAEVAQFLSSETSGTLPFYAQVGFFETHTPFDFGGVDPDDSLGVEVPPFLVEDSESRAAIAGLQGAMRAVDRAVTTIAEALAENGLEDETLLVITTDHGIEVPRSKWTLYDPGIGIFLIMRCPAIELVGGRACSVLSSNVDYVPTILDMIGLQGPGSLDGVSLLPALQGKQSEAQSQPVFSLYHKTHARGVRTDTMKYIRYFDAATDYSKVPVRLRDVLAKRGIGENEELYDLSIDPNEFENRVDDPAYRSGREELAGLLFRWMEEVEDPLLDGPVATPSYRRAIDQYHMWKRQ